MPKSCGSYMNSRRFMVSLTAHFFTFNDSCSVNDELEKCFVDT